jgi:uncharacterized protein
MVFVMPLPAPIWFVAALVPMVASQVLRLHQHDPGGWIFWDYVGRLAGLAVLAALAWPVAFRRERLRMPWMQIPFWVLGIVLADHYLGGWIRTTGNDLFPSTVLGHYPQPSSLSDWHFRRGLAAPRAILANYDVLRGWIGSIRG